MRTTKTKQLVIRIGATDRKRKEIERHMRNLLNDWLGKPGVYHLTITEENFEQRKEAK